VARVNTASTAILRGARRRGRGDGVAAGVLVFAERRYGDESDPVTRRPTIPDPHPKQGPAFAD